MLFFSWQTFGQTIEKKQYKATKISVAPVIDGILDDEAWKSGDWAGDFTQNQPYSGGLHLRELNLKFCLMKIICMWLLKHMIQVRTAL